MCIVAIGALGELFGELLADVIIDLAVELCPAKVADQATGVNV